MGALIQSILSGLAGAGSDYGKAKQAHDAEEVRRQQIFEQLAGARQSRGLAQKQFAYEQLVGQQTEAERLRKHSEWEASTWEKPLRYPGPNGKVMEWNAILQKGRETDVPNSALKLLEENKFGDWVKLPDGQWARPIIDKKTLKPTGEYEVGAGPGWAYPLVRQVYKKITGPDGVTEYYIPVTESSAKEVPPTGGASSPVPPAGGATPSAPPRRGKGTTAKAGTPSPSGVPRGAISAGRKLNTQERQSLATAQQMRGGVARMVSTIESAGLQNDNSPITPFINWIEYSKTHFEPDDPVRAQLIKDAALIGLQGVAPFIRIGRGKYIYEKAQQHLPQPNDSPKLLYDKVKWLRDNVIDDFITYTLNPMGDTTSAPQVEGEVEINGKTIKLGPK